MWHCAADDHLPCPGLHLTTSNKVPSDEPMTSQPTGRLGADLSETPNPATPQFARADLIHQAALLDQSGHNALSGALGDGTPPQVFIMSPELDSILHMYDYTGSARRAPLRAHPGFTLGLLSPLPLEPFSRDPYLCLPAHPSRASIA